MSYNTTIWLDYDIDIISDEGAREREGYTRRKVFTTEEQIDWALKQVKANIFDLNDSCLYQDDCIKIKITLEYVPEDK